MKPITKEAVPKEDCAGGGELAAFLAPRPLPAFPALPPPAGTAHPWDQRALAVKMPGSLSAKQNESRNSPLVRENFAKNFSISETASTFITQFLPAHNLPIFIPGIESFCQVRAI